MQRNDNLSWVIKWNWITLWIFKSIKANWTMSKKSFMLNIELTMKRSSCWFVPSMWTSRFLAIPWEKSDFRNWRLVSDQWQQYMNSGIFLINTNKMICNILYSEYYLNLCSKKRGGKIFYFIFCVEVMFFLLNAIFLFHTSEVSNKGI